MPFPKTTSRCFPLAFWAKERRKTWPGRKEGCVSMAREYRPPLPPQKALGSDAWHSIGMIDSYTRGFRLGYCRRWFLSTSEASKRHPNLQALVKKYPYLTCQRPSVFALLGLAAPSQFGWLFGCLKRCWEVLV